MDESTLVSSATK